NRVFDVLADFVAIAADGDLQMALVADDVVLGAAVDRADGDDGRVGRLDLAADDRLQIEDELSAHDDGVDRGVRIGPVAAAADERDIAAIDVGQSIAASDA